MDEIYKEVRFDVYCVTCKYEKTKETEEPCNECLGCPVNAYSHKPVKWTVKDDKK